MPRNLPTGMSAIRRHEQLRMHEFWRLSRPLPGKVSGQVIPGKIPRHVDDGPPSEASCRNWSCSGRFGIQLFRRQFFSNRRRLAMTSAATPKRPPKGSVTNPNALLPAASHSVKPTRGATPSALCNAPPSASGGARSRRTNLSSSRSLAAARRSLLSGRLGAQQFFGGPAAAFCGFDQGKQLVG